MGADLELVVGGRPVRFPAVWLRDNCPCPDCLAPGTGQKLNDITDIPNGLAITRTEDAGESVLVTFAPDQHRSVFPRSWLEDLRLGFVLLSGLSAVPGRVLEVAASFGYVRETNYGRLFDVRVEPVPGNLAFTSRAIRPHTDNPYRDPAPTVQLLHCLRAAGEGGDTGLVDGFAAAGELRARDAQSFGTLARTPVSFGYVDKETELRASLPLIQLSGRGARAAGGRGPAARRRAFAE